MVLQKVKVNEVLYIDNFLKWIYSLHKVRKCNVPAKNRVSCAGEKKWKIWMPGLFDSRKCEMTPNLALKILCV